MTYDISLEYQNIPHYSPFCHLNEMSPQYRDAPFHLPFVERDGRLCPVHPDTFADLGLEASEIVSSTLVYPTSSFRTVFNPSDNTCYKLHLQRRITRLVRTLSSRTLKVSQRVGSLLAQHPCPNFHFLPEFCHFATREEFNFIERPMGEAALIPWFCAIRTKHYGKEFMLTAAKRMLHAWLFYASRDIFLELHTQNMLVDDEARVYYRDLSDGIGFADPLRRPPWANEDFKAADVAACVFDRAVCRQNLDHLFTHYSGFSSAEREDLREYLQREIERFHISFPVYSMDFSQGTPEHLPEKREITWWRQPSLRCAIA